MNNKNDKMKRFILLLTLPLFFACKKEGDKQLSKNQSLSAECFKEMEPTDFEQSCYFDSTYHCEQIVSQDFIPISDDDREWLKLFCLDNFDRIYFHDENDNETYLEISNKRFLTTFNNVGMGSCNDGRLKVTCVETEFANVEIRVPAASMTINVGIRNNFDVLPNGKIESFVAVEAYTFNSTAQQSNQFIYHLNAIPEFGAGLAQEFFPEIEILGKTFEEVYTSDDSNPIITRNPDALKIFYNKEFGIVSFVDNNATQWVLND